MSKNTRIVIALCVVLVLIVLLIGYWAEARRARQTVAAAGTVFSVEKEAKRGKRGKDNTIVTLAFRAGSTTVRSRARVTGVHLEDYPVGRLIRICYDPADPESIRIEDGACG